MGVDAEIRFESAEWEKLIKGVSERWDSVKSRKEFGGIVSSVVFRDIMDHFDQSMGPDAPWKSWSDVYAEHMARIGKGGNNILIDTGKLRQSITPVKGKWRGTDAGIVFYSAVPYAAAHDKGSEKLNLPARPFMWLSNNGFDAMIDIIQNWLAEGES